MKSLHWIGTSLSYSYDFMCIYYFNVTLSLLYHLEITPVGIHIHTCISDNYMYINAIEHFNYQLTETYTEREREREVLQGSNTGSSSHPSIAHVKPLHSCPEYHQLYVSLKCDVYYYNYYYIGY